LQLGEVTFAKSGGAIAGTLSEMRFFSGVAEVAEATGNSSRAVWWHYSRCSLFQALWLSGKQLRPEFAAAILNFPLQ